MSDLQLSLDADKLSDSGGESFESELQQIGADFESKSDSPHCRGLAKTRRQEDAALKLIRQIDALGSTSLDLSNCGLIHLPEEILELKALEYLYLEGNELTYLPENFFEQLPNLQWLDLRQNYLSRLPTAKIGQHENLRNLLLEGNNLKTLPLELGYLKTLNGLNISNNPLEFPPADVLEKGTVAVLRFLTEMLEVKSAKFTNGDSISLSKESSSSDDEWDGSLGEIARMRQRARSKQHHSAEDFSGLVPHSAELHRPVSYMEMKNQHFEKLKRVGASGKVDRKKSASSVMSWKVNQYPEPPSPNYVIEKMADDRHKAKTREMKERQEAILQRRRDEVMLKDWRTETKRLKEKKYFESVRSGVKDFIDPAAKAPYGYDKDRLKMMSNEERIKYDVKAAHEKLRRPMSPGTRQLIEDEKATRIRELEKRIKEHTSQMVDRRKKPKGNPKEEMEAAKRELMVAENLQDTLKSQKTELEYRLRAFSADTATRFEKRSQIK